MPDQVPPDPAAPVKSGFASSEFVVTVISALTAAAVTIIGMVQGKPEYVTMGLGTLGVGGAVYSGARAYVKGKSA